MLQRIIIKGFKSIKTMDIELRPLNILIGAIDICLLNCNHQQISPAIYKIPNLYIALGEIKGGIDPAGADEHWKTAKTALSRIWKAFYQVDLSPHTFFVGAAIEKRMTEEIWSDLEEGKLSNAANMTNDHQVDSMCNWLINL